MNVISLMGAEVRSVRILAETDVVVTVFGCWWPEGRDCHMSELFHLFNCGSLAVPQGVIISLRCSLCTVPLNGVTFITRAVQSPGFDH